MTTTTSTNRPPFLHQHKRIFQIFHLFDEFVNSATDQTRFRKFFPNGVSKQFFPLESSQNKYICLHGLYTDPSLFQLVNPYHVKTIEFHRNFKLNSGGILCGITLETFTYFLKNDEISYQKQSVNSFFPNNEYKWLGPDKHDSLHEDDFEKIISEIETTMVKFI